MSLESRVTALEARERIRELRYRYGDCVDNGRWKEWASLFANDGWLSADGTEQIQGREALAAFGASTIEEAFDYSAHTMHNPIIELDGDRARGHWLVEAFASRPDGSLDWHRGEYDDRYTREDGEWRFASVSVTINATTSGQFRQSVERDPRRDKDLIQIRVRV